MVFFELEELPRWRLEAETFEDEMRLRRFFRHPSTRRRILDVMLDALEDAA